MLFIMMPGEVDRANASGKFATVAVEETIPYPDGCCGFVLARLAYAPDIDAVFVASWRHCGSLSPRPGRWPASR